MEKANAGNLQVTASPNPARDHFTFVARSNSNEKLTIVVTDAAGRVVERKLNNPANGTIQLGNRLPAGIYFAEIIQVTHKKILKLIKE